MNRPASKVELRAWIETEHAVLDRLLETLNAEQMSLAGIPAGWTEEATKTGVAIKDILYHLSCWESRMWAHLEALNRGEALLEGRNALSTARFNALLYEESQERAAEAILEEYQAQFFRTQERIEAMDEEALLKANEGGLIGYNTYSHYRWATKKIRPWARKLGQAVPK